MLFSLSNFSLIILIFLLLWLIILSVLFYRFFGHYKKLTEGVAKKDLKSILEKIMLDISKEHRQINELSSQIKKIEKNSFYHIQKIGLIRFNPFADTGGNQSFSLALLDGEDNGLVISSLHSREVTRIYAKPIKRGKATEYQLSTEEIQAIKNARKIH